QCHLFTTYKSIRNLTTYNVNAQPVYASLHGSSNVHWSESRSSGSGKSRRSRTVHYRSEEIYIDQTWPYIPSSDGPLASTSIPAEFLYPVDFQLPARSIVIEGASGKIAVPHSSEHRPPWRFDTADARDCTQSYATRPVNYGAGNLIGPHSTSDEYDVRLLLVLSRACFVRFGVSIDLEQERLRARTESVRVVANW
uniref:Arrestin_N domain-containing protein n=1 Tax=Macrostomum lignano TaxID=282301 RepID=A0A1I8FDD5_9PLAT